MNEIWKPIEGYEGKYEVSNLGNIKNSRNKLLKPFKTGNDYFKVGLSYNNKNKQHFIHRLVAQTFLDNPDNLPQVTHKDENTQNNCIDNLEWCDHSYNQNYGSRNYKVQEKLGIKVNQYDLRGNFIKTFNSITEAQKNCKTTNICRCLKGEFKQTGGYVWKYANINARNERKYLSNE